MERRAGEHSGWRLARLPDSVQNDPMPSTYSLPRLVLGGWGVVLLGFAARDAFFPELVNSGSPALPEAWRRGANILGHTLNGLLLLAPTRDLKQPSVRVLLFASLVVLFGWYALMVQGDRDPRMAFVVMACLYALPTLVSVAMGLHAAEIDRKKERPDVA